MAQNMSLFCVHLKKCVLCCFGIKYFINVIFRSSRLVVSSVWSSVPLLTFCLLILSITERWILKSLLLWFFCGILFLFFFFCHTACGIFVPFPGIETGPSKMRVKSPTTGPPGNSLFYCEFISFFSELLSALLHIFWSFVKYIHI